MSSIITELAQWKAHMLTCPTTITYETNSEFRAHVRRIFNFTPGVCTYYGDSATQMSETGGIGPVMESENGEIDPETYMVQLQEPTEEDDLITNDELAYDDDAMTRGRNCWYQFTEDHPDFLEIYTHAAYKMISTDPTIGQCVLCGFQTFPEYYKCIRTFLLTGTPDSASMSYLANYFKPSIEN